jgi:hypothetical protein
LVAVMFAALAAGAQQSVTLNVPGTPDNAPTRLVGCLMPAGGTTSMPGSGGSSGTGPAGMNADAANSSVSFAIRLGKKKRQPETSYSLVGGDAAELRRYANSPVEVQGVLEPITDPAGPGKTVTMHTKGKATTPPRQFRITAIKQIPGSCGGQ